MSTSDDLRARMHMGDESGDVVIEAAADPDAGARPPNPERLVITPEEFASAKLAPRCIVRHYLYADVAVLAAAGGSGKTTLVLYEVVHIALERDLYGLPVESPGPVVIVTAEDQREIMVARLREVCAALHLTADECRTVRERVLVWDVTGIVCRLAELDERGNVNLTGLADAIVEAYRELSPAMVYFDPTVNFHPGERLVNDSEQSLILAARRIVRGLGGCVRLVHHTGKANAKEGTLDQYSPRGGSALSDGARMVAVLRPWNPEQDKLEPPPGFTLTSSETGLILARAKGSYHPPQPHIWLKRRGYGFEYMIDTPRDKDAKRRAQEAQVLTFLRSELRHSPPRYHTRTSLDTQDIGMSRAEMRAAVAALEVSGQLRESDLPEERKHGGRKTYLDPNHPAGGTGGVSDFSDSTPPRSTTPPPYKEDNGGGVDPATVSPTPPGSTAGYGGVGGVEANSDRGDGQLWSNGEREGCIL